MWVYDTTYQLTCNLAKLPESIADNGPPPACSCRDTKSSTLNTYTFMLVSIVCQLIRLLDRIQSMGAMYYPCMRVHRATVRI